MARLTKEAKTLKEKISAKLAGYEQRQAMRDASRGFRNRLYRVYRARRDGTLDEYKNAIRWLSSNSYDYQQRVDLKVTTLTLKNGVTLVYDPTGKLSYAKRPRSAGYSYGDSLWS